MIRVDKATAAKIAAQLGEAVPKRKHKYGARRTTIDGTVFASAREANRYGELKLLEKAGQIRCLRRQVEYELHAFGGKVVGKYVADAVYLEGGREIVEDTKGVRTEVYRWKKRHMLAEYGIRIRET